ncbi:MAG: hypothetical protein BIP78_0798 [Candidatus Bipolaricaulis sibiricus]|uniref:Uncharacterized protein n=1 Tax=Bipolaricaulis sibiricus TaxID=2501609 RepID=A0A410FUA0_BIPS1|nr:MAG: hypothetical protein BIP78_0798 [Candidatus Bipolaricaulis sibiricus]
MSRGYAPWVERTGADDGDSVEEGQRSGGLRTGEPRESHRAGRDLSIAGPRAFQS